MSNGEHTYAALKSHIIQVLVDEFNPDWETLAEKAYLGFFKDLQDDAKIEINIVDYEDDDKCEMKPDAELHLRIYLNDESLETVGENVPLSKLLIDAARWDCRTDLLRALGNSLAAFHAYLEKETGA